MRKIILSLTLLVVTFATTTSCREKTTETKTVIREVEAKSTDDDGILERAAKKVDERVNDEIDEEIDRIGDDD
ncbi:hypothetical protein ULMS_23920 [Patiriisocius marinistellae]|uniref:Uncharacterized protein n=1 Tax=Patiriisocius marinistellae TaxID=2494560 RepID=A0A5J4G061_9FLAO|nr:hypothetical protein [Patiriisocius marinistellae]GEQ86884.1 hypothetical protein ULMS_23920 [Patiriisocius marinistellae]